MKKLFLVIFSLLLLSASAHAQLLRFGAKGGINASSFNVNELRAQGLEIRDGNLETGFHLGLMTRINIPVLPIFIQPEAIFTRARGSYEVDLSGSVGPGATSLATVDFSRLDFPIMVGYKLGPARFNLGPVASIMLSEDVRIGQVVTGFSQEFRNATWGYQLGLGLDLWKITVDARYEGNFSRYSDNATFLGQQYDFDTRVNQFIFSLGYWF